MEQDKAFLGKEPIGKLLLKLALPTVAAQMINMLYNLVDRIYIGHIPAPLPYSAAIGEIPKEKKFRGKGL